MITVTTKCYSGSPNPVTKTIFFQEFFCQILKISFGKRNVGSNRNLGVALMITMLLRTLDYAVFMDSPSRVILTLSPSWPAFPSTLMRS